MNEPFDKETDNKETTDEMTAELTDEQRQFAEQAKTLFDSSVDRLDAATLSRLNQGRHAALEELQKTRSAGQWVRWIPATGVAAVAIVTVMVMRGPEPGELSIEPVTAADFEMLLEDESLEMLQDLEFYSWLEASDLDTNGNVG